MRKLVVISIMALAMVTLMVGTALAHGSATAINSVYTDKTSPSQTCTACHPTDVTKHTSGPHGGYTTTSNKCALCHTVHVAGNTSLLPGATVTSACNFCHDLTATELAPYNQSTSLTVYSAHRVAGITFNNSWSFRDMGTKASSTHSTLGAGLDVTTATVPGADDANGTTGTITNNAAGGKLSASLFTCDSCHTPHALAGTTVNKYLGESDVKVSGNGLTAPDQKLFLTDRILRKTINGNVAADYGTAWCATCHEGRDNMNSAAGMYNHPVDRSLVGYDLINKYTGTYNGGATSADVVQTDANGANYIIVDADNSMGVKSMTADPRSNRMYALGANGGAAGADANPLGGNFADGTMKFSDYAVNGPSCQQCHASARNVAAAFSANVNPERESFPHVGGNKALLVETGDDFCTNCHGFGTLP